MLHTKLQVGCARANAVNGFHLWWGKFMLNFCSKKYIEKTLDEMKWWCPVCIFNSRFSIAIPRCANNFIIINLCSNQQVVVLLRCRRPNDQNAASVRMRTKSIVIQVRSQGHALGCITGRFCVCCRYSVRSSLDTSSRWRSLRNAVTVRAKS